MFVLENLLCGNACGVKTMCLCEAEIGRLVHGMQGTSCLEVLTCHVEFCVPAHLASAHLPAQLKLRLLQHLPGSAAASQLYYTCGFAEVGTCGMREADTILKWRVYEHSCR